MHGRRGTPVQGSERAGDSGGYPLRDEATEPFPPPSAPAPPSESDAVGQDEIYAAPPVPPASEPRHRRPFPGGPWPVLLAVLLLLAGLGVAYAVTRPNQGSRTGGPQPAVGAAPAPTPPQPPRSPSPPKTTPAVQQPAQPAEPASVAVPLLVGVSLPRAVATLKRARLTASVVHVTTNAPEGRVVAQHPAPGANVPQGGRVRLSVSVQQLVSVPDVTGLQGLAAVHTLQDDHLVASLRYVPSTEPARRVVSQWPQAGANVRRGTGVRLNLSQGLRASVTVPNVVGEDEAAARSDLTAAGFEVRSVDSTTTDPAEAGVVVDEQPSGGSSASRGSAVTIHVGRYTGG
jgi:PASTA domain